MVWPYLCVKHSLMILNAPKTHDAKLSAQTCGMCRATLMYSLHAQRHRSVRGVKSGRGFVEPRLSPGAATGCASGGPPPSREADAATPKARCVSFQYICADLNWTASSCPHCHFRALCQLARCHRPFRTLATHDVNGAPKCSNNQGWKCLFFSSLLSPTQDLLGWSAFRRMDFAPRGFLSADLCPGDP